MKQGSFALICVLGMSCTCGGRTGGSSDGPTELVARSGRPGSFEEWTEADLTTEGGREVLAFSAGGVMALSAALLLSTGRTVENAEDGGCWSVNEEALADGASRATVRGEGCTSGETIRISGQVTYERHERACGARTEIAFFDWTQSGSVHCGDGSDATGTLRYNGTLSVDECARTSDLDLRVDGTGTEQLPTGCRDVRTRRVRYQARETGPEDAPFIHGRGRVALASAGRADLQTNDQVGPRSEICVTESSTGVTRASAAGHTAEVRYDGAELCTDPGKAPLFVDGTARGEAPYACSAGGSSPALPFLAVLLLGLRPRRTP